MAEELVIPVGSVQIELVRGNITKIAADAIVNAANSNLAGGGGVDGAIHSAGGPAIMQELDAIRAGIGSCPAGGAVVTGAGRLPAQYVIHAVGPIYRDGNHGEPEALASCYRTSLNLAAERQVKTISFPAISTGIYGYPIKAAAAMALKTVAEWLSEHTGPVETVMLVQFSDRDQAVYFEQAQHYLRLGASGG
jgi:O-acetyl-ADP-ribose deacetylase (regulator of RNase III)